MEEEIRKQYETETGKKWFTVPFTHGEQAFASWGYQLWLEKKVSQVEPVVKVNFADFKMAVSLLRDLADLQNGSPLVTYEKEWQRTMDNIYAFLNEHESKISA